MKWLLSLFTGGFGGYLIVAGLVGVIAASISGYLVAMAKDKQIAQAELATASLRASYAERDTASLEVSLSTLQGFIAGMRSAELNFSNFQNQLKGQFAAIEKDIKNAPPVPIDCVVDPVRLRALSDATAAANTTQTSPTAK